MRRFNLSVETLKRLRLLSRVEQAILVTELEGIHGAQRAFEREREAHGQSELFIRNALKKKSVLSQTPAHLRQMEADLCTHLLVLGDSVRRAKEALERDAAQLAQLRRERERALSEAQRRGEEISVLEQKRVRQLRSSFVASEEEKLEELSILRGDEAAEREQG